MLTIQKVFRKKVEIAGEFSMFPANWKRLLGRMIVVQCNADLSELIQTRRTLVQLHVPLVLLAAAVRTTVR